MLIKEGEHQQLDFKFAVNDSQKIARSLVAFANTDGGRLLIGVKDNGTIAGIRNEEEVFMIESASQLFCRPEISPKYIRHSISGKNVLEIRVFKSEQLYKCKDESGKWRMYVRVADSNFLANDVLYKARQKQLDKTNIIVRYSSEESILFDWLNNYISITEEQFCEIAKIGKKRAVEILSNLLAINLLRVKIVDEFVIYLYV